MLDIRSKDRIAVKKTQTPNPLKLAQPGEKSAIRQAIFVNGCSQRIESERKARPTGDHLAWSTVDKFLKRSKRGDNAPPVMSTRLQ